jgi:hypothetical protein
MTNVGLPRILTWLSGTLVAALVVVSVALAVVTRDPWPSNDGLTIAVLAVTATVGLVIVAKQPRNAIGWLFIGTVLIGLVDAVARGYLVLDYRQHGGSLPLGELAVELRGGTALSTFLVAFLSILLFPDGKAPSRWWRRTVWVYVIAATAFSVAQFAGQALHLGPQQIDIRGDVSNNSTGPVAAYFWVLVPFFLGFWIASIVHQVRCWRTATGERRAQLKWMMSGAAVCVVSGIALVVAGDGSSIPSRVIADLSLVGIATLPVAIGVGILKYRLYEIDRLVSRTISYAVVTSVLAGVFLGVVVLATRVLPFSSPVAVAASTLAAAALFNPLRKRVQQVVDRRFNRSRYDAEATVAVYSARLRDAMASRHSGRSCERLSTASSLRSTRPSGSGMRGHDIHASRRVRLAALRARARDRSGDRRPRSDRRGGLLTYSHIGI